MSTTRIQKEILSEIISGLEKASHLYGGLASALDASMLEKDIIQLSEAETALHKSFRDLNDLIKR